jgi:hypothetical protein
MSAQILRKRRTLAMRRLALAAIGVSYVVLSGTPFGADIGIANPSAVAAALGGRHATAHPTEPPAINGKTRSATAIIENVDVAFGSRSIAANPG